ncbi:hypothetical protein [Halobaculum sp. P14]|uniref:hypothetical protein n=1 Tax=Halobaculum sp. P14 TaxID=3421638 RepID=UPI003EBD98CD
MVPHRYPLSVAVGVTVAAYGVSYAIAAAPYGYVAIPGAVLPGGWLAAHGLLNGVAAAVDADGETDADEPPDDAGGSGGDDDRDGGDEAEGSADEGDDEPAFRRSDVEVAGRVPFQ